MFGQKDGGNVVVFSHRLLTFKQSGAKVALKNVLMHSEEQVNAKVQSICSSEHLAVDMLEAIEN